MNKAFTRIAAAALTLALGLGLSGCTKTETPVAIGLITKQEDNPYWIEMRQVAQETADRLGADLTTATGSSDIDVESQRQALNQMVAQGVDGILIAPTDSTALAPEIASARAAGITVIALDTPMADEVTNAYFGTDNFRAGQLIGEYARAKIIELGAQPQVAMLNLAPGISSGEERAEGFSNGFALTPTELIVEADSQGDRALAEQLLTAALAENPGINVVYAINEPAALGAVAALKAAGKDLTQVVVVSVDGGCEAMKNAVRPGDIDATAMQFPQNMAREGVKAIVAQVRQQESPPNYLATGTQLVSGSPAPGVESQNVEYGIRTCWGG